MRGLLLFCSFILFYACSETPFFESKIEIPEANWSYEYIPSFTVPVKDTTQNHDLFLELKHSPDFSYQNLYLKINTTFPNGEIKEEQLSIDLANNLGSWIGKCKGGSCQINIYLLENFKFSDPGDYKFAFEQYSRSKELKGIQSLSFKINRLGNQ